MMKLSTTLPFLLLVLPAALHAGEAVLTFEKDVRPILKTHCTHCHGEEENPEGGLDLRLRRFMDKTLKDGGHVLIPGQPDKSELVQAAVRGDMPKKGKKLTAEEIATLQKWVAQGAKTARPEPATLA